LVLKDYRPEAGRDPTQGARPGSENRSSTRHGGVSGRVRARRSRRGTGRKPRWTAAKDPGASPLDKTVSYAPIADPVVEEDYYALSALDAKGGVTGAALMAEPVRRQRLRLLGQLTPEPYARRGAGGSVA
jgi:hypothetical protein